MKLNKANKLITYLSILALGAAGITGCSLETKDWTGEYDVVPQHNMDVNPNKKSIAFIIDNSGSMDEQLNGVAKIDSARSAFKKMVAIYQKANNKNHNIETTVIAFENTYSATVVDPIKPFNGASLVQKVDSLDCDNDTPLGIALALAQQELNKTNAIKYIVMLTDGESNVGRNPDTIYGRINNVTDSMGTYRTRLFVIPYNTDPKQFLGLKERGAIVYEGDDGKNLAEVLCKTADKILAEDPNQH